MNRHATWRESGRARGSTGYLVLCQMSIGADRVETPRAARATVAAREIYSP